MASLATAATSRHGAMGGQQVAAPRALRRGETRTSLGAPRRSCAGAARAVPRVGGQWGT